MSASVLRNRYLREFAGLGKYRAWAAWMIVAGYVFQAGLAVILGCWIVAQPIGWPSAVAIVVLMLFIGTRLRGLNNIIHECSHATFARRREDNYLIGKICASFLFSSFLDYRDEHLSHHAHLGDYEKDLDLQGIEKLALHDPVTPRVFLRHLITPFLGRHLPYYLHLNFSVRDGAPFIILKAVILFCVAAYLLYYPVQTMLFVVLPYVLFYSALNYWADCMDHAGLIEEGDDLEASRNLLAPKVLRYVFFPRNDCFHLVHHLFPHVPARHLEATHEVLAQDAVYASRPNAVRGEAVQGQAPAAVSPAE